MNTVEAIACVVAVRLLDTNCVKNGKKEGLKKGGGYFEEIEQNMGDSRYVLDMGLLSSSLSFVPLIYLF